MANAPAFLNADLDLWHTGKLDALLESLEKRMFVLTHERGRLHPGMASGRASGYSARLELNAEPATPDKGVLAIAHAVDRLPAPARRLWDSVRFKQLSIGFEGVPSGRVPIYSHLSPRAVAACASIDCQLQTVFYRPEVPVRL